MKLNISLFANKDLLKIFGALLSVVIIMFASNYLVYTNSLSNIYSQVNENNKLSVQATIRSFDESFKDINGLIYSIQMLPYKTWKSHEDGTMDLHETYRMYKDIGELTNSIDYIEEVAVFHKNSNLAITRVGTISLDQLFSQQYYNKNYVSDFWRTFSNTPHPLRVFPAQLYSKKGADSLQNLLPVLGSNQLSDLNVLVFLNMDKLLQHIYQSASLLQGTSLIVLDQNRNVVLNTEADWDLVEAMKDLNIGTQSETTLKNKDYEYTLIKSEYNGFIYINKSPYKFTNMKTVADTNRNIIWIAITYVVLLAALLSYYLYKAVRSILLLIGGRDIGGASYRNIKTGIVNIQQENESFKTQMEFIRGEMRKSAFLHVLREPNPSLEAVQRIEPYLADIFQDKYFLLAAVHLQPNPNPEQTQALVEDNTAPLQEGLQERLGKTMVFQLTNRSYLAVIGIRLPSEREPAMKQLRGLTKQWQSAERKDHPPIIVVSRLHAAKTANCPIAYQEVEEGLTNRNIHQDEPVIDCLAIRYTWKVHLPLDEIERASHSLKVGNIVNAIRIVDDILAANVMLRIHLHQSVQVWKTLFYSFLKLLDSSAASSNDILALEAEFNQSIEQAFRQETMREALLKAIRVILEKTRHENRNKLNPADIALYIDQHYMDNLHLDHMAIHAETSPKYFSNYFKRQFGVNFVEYLNKVRLTHAKELLKRTDMTVAEIGERTGYLTATTFTNTFRKYWGVSPSEYRKQGM